MTTFGPFYPGRLQELVNHAERMWRVLKVEESHDACADLRDAWLAGRAAELERFVESLTAEWHARTRSLESIARALSAYIEDLHDGMLENLGPRGLDCCLAGLDTTTVPLECPSRRPSSASPS